MSIPSPLDTLHTARHHRNQPSSSTAILNRSDTSLVVEDGGQPEPVRGVQRPSHTRRREWDASGVGARPISRLVHLSRTVWLFTRVRCHSCLLPSNIIVYLNNISFIIVIFYRSLISNSPSNLGFGLAGLAAAGGSQCQAARQTARSLHQVSHTAVTDSLY